MQRRELSAQEQRVARTAYAYGVDLRRARWVESTTLTEPLLSAVDRRWNALVHALEQTSLEPAACSPPLAVLEAITEIGRLLRAPTPAVRCLRADAGAGWPAATPLGPVRGGVHWLIVDPAALMAMDPRTRAFVLGQGLGHLQCDHGPLFAAHLMAYVLGGGATWLPWALRPWSRVAAYSADRAGLLACGDLEIAQSALRRGDRPPAWWPPSASPAIRGQALADFARSSVAVRVRTLQSAMHAESGAGGSPPAGESPPARDGVGEASPADPAQSDTSREALPWSLARCDARLTRRLGIL